MIRFLDLAEDDLNAIYKQYATINFDLAERFYAELLSVLEHIEQFPKSGRIFKGEIRETGLQRFPYLVLYAHLPFNNTIIVYGLMHYKRNTGIKKKRITKKK